MNCPKCGAPLTRSDLCEKCGTQLSYAPNYYYQTPQYCPQKQRSTGETVAIVIAIIVSILSLFAAFVICVYIGSSNESYSDDSYYYDEIASEYYGEYYDDNNVIPEGVEENFNDKLFSFSSGRVDVDYSLMIEEAFRGEAAAALLEGAALPEIDDDEEFFVYKFKFTIRSQDIDAYFLFPFFPDAKLDGQFNNIFDLKLNYVNCDSLLGDSESVELWCAYVINKDQNAPGVIWESNNRKCMFRAKNNIQTSSEGITPGAAIKKSDTSVDE